LLLLTTFLLAGCVEDEGPKVDIFDVRLLTAAPLSGPWELAAEQGLGRIAGDLEAEIQRVRCAPERLSEAIQGSAETGPPDLVFCVGAGFDNAAFTEAAVHPESRFIILPGAVTGDNVASIDFVADGAAYLGGVVAGTLSKAGITGIIRGQGRPWLETIEEGFVAGFRSRWRRAEAHSASGPDAPWELIRVGVEVALYAGDSPDPAVLAAAHNAGLLLVTVDTELLATEPDIAVAAISLDVAEAMVRVAREVRDGNFRGRVYTFDLGSGVVDLDLSSVLDMARRPDVIHSLEEARTEVTAGLIEVEALGI